MNEMKEPFLDLTLVDKGYERWAREEVRERKFKTTHYAVPVATHGQRAFVDHEIAELHYLMWQAGVHTIESCQSVYEGGPKWTADEGHTTMLCFRDAESVTLFLTLVAREPTEPGELNDRMTDCNLGYDGEGCWDWDMFVTMDGRRPILRPSVLFPLSDVVLLVDRFKKEMQ